MESSPKIRTNSDPSVNRSKREPYKRSAGRYCFGNHSEAPVTETLLRRNPARLKGVLKKSKQTATRVSQNFYFELLLTKSLLGLSPAGCGVKWHICAHRSGFTPASELLDSSLAKAATANRFFAGNQHHFILINMGSQTCEINVGMKGFFFYSIRLLHKSCPHLRQKIVKKFVSGSLRHRKNPRRIINMPF